MGWFTRGTGRTYDILSGTAASMGYFTKKVIAYVTLNRKCAKCDQSHLPNDHDCRMNFVGSAKAMEPHAAVLLTKDHRNLVECNIEVGIFIADNDSSSICAVRAANDHEILKQSDKNHTSKGVVSELYKIRHEVNMSQAIRNIPYHAFNHHNNCGNWCSYKSDPDNYQHANIGDGFNDENYGASSHPNENLNAMIVSKAPKTRLYSKSASGDGRVACAISKKNIGEKYATDLTQSLTILSGNYSKKFCSKVDCFRQNRYANSVTRAAKLKRIALKKSKTALKNKNETKEGIIYESNIGLRHSLHESLIITKVHNRKGSISILFDLETGGFCKSCDILQIAAKYEQYEFSVYIKPTQTISEEASKVHGLLMMHDRLVHHGKPILTVTLSEALVGLYEFLSLFQQRCIVTAHNCKFDYPRLMCALDKCFLKEHFRAIILGYSNSLPMIKKKTGKTKKGENKLENIARELEINQDKAHDALYDVIMLDKVLKKLNITTNDLLGSFLSWDDACNKIKFSENLPNALKKLQLLKDCVPTGMRKKMAAANVSYETLENAYKTSKYTNIVQVLGKDENGVVKVTKADLVSSEEERAR
ncbi:hypothetical protein PV325_005506 [Microctonus aethiopoides]|nr:hypothetical protein PV325_005506 [Microctonus aethiopoides]